MPGSDDFLTQGSEHKKHLALRDAPEETATEVRLRQELSEAKEVLKHEEIAAGQGLGERPKTSAASRRSSSQKGGRCCRCYAREGRGPGQINRGPKKGNSP